MMIMIRLLFNETSYLYYVSAIHLQYFVRRGEGVNFRKGNNYSYSLEYKYYSITLIL